MTARQTALASQRRSGVVFWNEGPRWPTGPAPGSFMRVKMGADKDGKILVRWSRCTDPALRAMPDGHIDPWLKTISFWNADKPLIGC